MELYSFLSSSFQNNNNNNNNIVNNWVRYFNDIIVTEIESLNNFNFSINRDNIDPRELNIRFEYETARLPPMFVNTSFNSGNMNIRDFNVRFEIGSWYDIYTQNDSETQSNGLCNELIEENSTKKIITITTECSICLDTLLPGSCLRELNNCKHMYCIDCIDEWLKTHNSCPVCKRTVS